MERRQFIKRCGSVGLSCVGLTVLLEACRTSQIVNLVEKNNVLTIPRSDFILSKDKLIQYRKYILVRSERLNYPLIVYRFSDNDYTALLLQCSHQGVELNVNGDFLSCSAHGSEFSNRGEVLHGPADKKLITFPVTVDDKVIQINLG